MKNMIKPGDTEMLKDDYPEIKVGETVTCEKFLSNKKKVVFKGIVIGRFPKSRTGQGVFKVKVLEMITPEFISVSKVSKII